MAKTQLQIEQEEANKIVAAASKASDKKKSNIDARQIAPAASTKKSNDPANVAGKRKTGNQANLAGGKRTTTKSKQANVAGTKPDKAKKKDSAGKDKDKSSDSDSNTGNTGAGIYFANRNAADIIRQLFDMFVLGKPQAANDDQQFKMMYDYLKEDNTSLNVKQIINLDVPSSDKEADYIKSQESDPSVPKIFNPDEAMQPRPMEFMAYQGSLASMFRDISNAPFNELYWTFGDTKTSDGTQVPEKTLSTLHIRQTPFEEEQWSNLPYTEIYPKDLISLSFDITDNDQYSIFDLTSNELANKPSERAQVPPITDDANELIARYGYKYYELQTWYFGLSSTAEVPGMNSDDLKAAQEDQVDQSEDTSAANFYPSFETFEAYLLVDKKGFNAKNVTDDMIDVPSRYGGNGLFDVLKPILTNESKAYNSQRTMWEAAKDAAKKYFDAYPDKSAENPLNQNEWTGNYNYLKNNKFTLSKVAYISRFLPEWEHAIKDSQETQTTSNLYYALGKLGNVGDVKSKSGKKTIQQAANDIYRLSDVRIGSAQAYQLALYMAKHGGNFADKSAYAKILTQTKHSATQKGVTLTSNTSGGTDGNAMLAKYQRKEFNFYADNSKYLSGEFVTPGVIPLANGKIATPNVGEKALIHDARRGALYEVYIESLDYNFDFQSGYTLTWGFTRGLPVTKINDSKRWSMFWGHYADFKGGFFGENSFASIVDAAQKNADSANSSDSDSDGSDVDDSGSDNTTDKGDWILPIKGTTVYSGFGETAGRSYPHDGTDFVAHAGDKVRASHTGIVVQVGKPPHGAVEWAGYTIVIKSGSIYTVYQEFGSTPGYGGKTLVKLHQRVKKGTTIGIVGSRPDGWTTGVHLHVGMSKLGIFNHSGTTTKGWIDPMSIIGK